MCLSVVNEIRGKKCKELNERDVLIGYKVFELSDNKDYHKYDTVVYEYSYHQGCPFVKPNQWLHSSKTMIGYGKIKYPSGFHIFANKKDAIDYAGNYQLVVGVYVDNVVAIGEQTNRKIYVARNMWVDSNDIVRKGSENKNIKIKWRGKK